MIDQSIAALFEELGAIAERDPSVRLDFRSDPAAASHYRPAEIATMSRADMEVGDELDALETLWREHHPALCALMPRIREIAGALREADDRAEPDAPSTLVYQMW